MKHLDISDNELLLDEFMCLFDGPCAWNELITLHIINAFKANEDAKVVDALNKMVSRGFISSLENLGIDRFFNRKVHWSRLQKLVLLECNGDALQNFADAVSWGYLPVLKTLCVKDFRGHNAEDVRWLSELGVSCHETCIPLDNEFSRVKCHCEL